MLEQDDDYLAVKVSELDNFVCERIARKVALLIWYEYKIRKSKKNYDIYFDEHFDKLLNMVVSNRRDNVYELSKNIKIKEK